MCTSTTELPAEALRRALLTRRCRLCRVRVCSVDNVVAHIRTGEVRRQKLRFGWNDGPVDKSSLERVRNRQRYDRLLRIINAYRLPPSDLSSDLPVELH
jgi:hypothetical protein